MSIIGPTASLHEGGNLSSPTASLHEGGASPCPRQHVRIECLKVAVEFRTGSITPDEAIGIAKSFEQYVLGGNRQTPPATAAKRGKKGK